MSGLQTPACLNHNIAYDFTVSDEERKRYTASIDAILATADLETISRKKIRQGLEAAEGRDLDDQKVRLSLRSRMLSLAPLTSCALLILPGCHQAAD